MTFPSLFRYGERRFQLGEGDSFHWDGSIPHRIENHGARPAKLLVARTPPGFLNATVYEARVETAAARGDGVRLIGG